MHSLNTSVLLLEEGLMILLTRVVVRIKCERVCKGWFLLDSLITAATAKSLQLCPTLCDPIDGSPSGYPVPGILQARTLVWVAISFSNAWKWKAKVNSLSCVRLSATPWTAAHQAPLSMGFSRQEYWTGVPSPSPVSSLLLRNYYHLFSCISVHFFS